MARRKANVIGQTLGPGRGGCHGHSPWLPLCDAPRDRSRPGRRAPQRHWSCRTRCGGRRRGSRASWSRPACASGCGAAGPPCVTAGSSACPRTRSTRRGTASSSARRHYAAFCDAAYGRFLHHHPDGGATEEAAAAAGGVHEQLGRRSSPGRWWRAPGEACVLWDVDARVGVERPWGVPAEQVDGGARRVWRSRDDDPVAYQGVLGRAVTARVAGGCCNCRRTRSGQASDRRARLTRLPGAGLIVGRAPAGVRVEDRARRTAVPIRILPPGAGHGRAAAAGAQLPRRRVRGR